MRQLKLGIANKIFSLALLLLAFTVALACYLLLHVSRMQDEVELIARREAPLAASLSRLNEYGLTRRLSFERWIGALQSRELDQTIIDEASRSYREHDELLRQEDAAIKTLLAMPVQADPRHEKIKVVRAILEQLEEAYPAITARQKEIVRLYASGQYAKARDLLMVMNDLQQIVQNQRKYLHEVTADLMKEAAEAATIREQEAYWLALALTFATLLLGLVFSSIISRRLVAPIHLLMDGIKHVEQGNLELELAVVSKDELGALTSSFNYFIRELRAKEEIKRTFGQYIDPRVLEQIIHDAGAETDGRRVMTVSFADIVGFTSLGERLTASGLVNLLNRHFTLQSEAVQSEQGVIDKFIGDAILVFWGPPFTPADEHPRRACRAALAQISALKLLSSELAELTGLRRDAPHVDIRIGISTGEVVVGNIGSDKARSYTVIGDAVNLGQRLEAANRVYGTRILISQATVEGAGSAIVTREIDYLLLKGKTEPVRAFELMGLQAEVAPAVLQLCSLFTEALDLYRLQQWDQAQVVFQKCLELCPDDRPSMVFLERIEQMKIAPPGDGWNGVWIVKVS